MTLHYLFGEIIVAVLIAIGISSLNIHAMQLQVKVISIEIDDRYLKIDPRQCLVGRSITLKVVADILN